jgi:hypothetical protein
MKHWYYAKANTRYGPLTGPELRQLANSGKLLSEDLVWKNGMADWQPAHTMPGLLPQQSAQRPRTAGVSLVIPQLQTIASKICGRCRWIWQESLLFCIRVSAWLLSTSRTFGSAGGQSVVAAANGPIQLCDITKSASNERAAGIGGALLLGRIMHVILVMILAGKILGVFIDFSGSENAAKHKTRFAGKNRSAAMTADEAREHLLDVAEKVEGPFLEIIEDIVYAVEMGEQPFSVADNRIYDFRMDSHRFARETIAAYEVWKAAKINEME